MPTHFRCIVKAVEFTEQERTLICAEWDSKARMLVVLRDLWTQTPVDPGNIVNVDGPFPDGPPPPRIVVSAESGMLVLLPDVLIPVSEVASACIRPLWHADISHLPRDAFHSVNTSTGTIVQRLLLQSLTDVAFDAAAVPDYVRATLADNSAHVAQNGHTHESVLSQLALFPVACPNFRSLFAGRVGERPHGADGLWCVAIEEEVSSRRYGLVGYPDVTACLPVYDAEGAVLGLRVGPVDIKAGRPRPADETQLTLYALILADKYGSELGGGLIYYAQPGRPAAVGFARDVVVRAIDTRNSLAALRVLRRRGLEHWTGPLPAGCLNYQGDDPGLVDLKFQAALNYRAAAISGRRDPGSIIQARIATSRLGDDECEYFASRSRAVALEEGAIEKALVDLWTTPALAREAGGKALADLVLVGGALSPVRARVLANRYSFARRAGTGSFLEGPFAEGDPVVVSVEPDLHAVARGIVREVLADRLMVSTFKPLDVNGVLLSARRIRDGPLVFAVDRDESAAGPERTVRHNLARLFGKGHQRLRALIVRLQAPKFAPVAPPSPRQALNAEQQAAVKRVLAANDYALIRALPGTGVLRTVTQCIRRLVEEGKSVLLASHSNAVLDTTMCALGGAPFGLLRLGKTGKMHPDAKKFTLSGGELGPPRSADEYYQRIHEPAVVAITCLSVKDTVFCGRTFDVCIVLDASRVTMPTCLGPLFHAKVFVLVGDERQLGPIIHAPSARREGLAETLFERLCKAHPSAVSDLTRQYRMSNTVMVPSNEVSYDGRLVCATAQVAEKVLRMPFRTQCLLQACWLDWVLDRSCTFVNTDGLFSTELRDDPTQNEAEVRLVDRICGALTAAGVDERKTGVLAYYRHHVNALKRALWRYRHVDVRTVDSAQGDVKDCIVVYVARTKPADQAEPFLADAQRLTTALTQARCKFVIFGSRRALGAIPVIHQLLNLYDSQRWSITPSRDHLEHRHCPAHPSSTQGRVLTPSPARHRPKRHRSLDAEYSGSPRPHKRATLEVDIDPGVATQAHQEVCHGMPVT